MKRILVALFVSMFFALVAWGDRFGPVVTDLRADLRATLDAGLTSGGYVFECPPENELCVFIASDPADTNCDVDSGPPTAGWNFVAGTDATLCDNQRFNGDVPDEHSRLDRPNGFWTHSGASGETAEMTAEITIVGAGAGVGEGTIFSMLQSNFTSLCVLSMDDIEVEDPAQLVLVTSTGFQDIGHTVTAGSRFRVVLQYDAGPDTCEVWIDPINVQPRSGTLANSSRSTGVNVNADIIQVRNINGANLLRIKNVAACPDGCTF